MNTHAPGPASYPSLSSGEVIVPALALRIDRVEANIAEMARYCSRVGVGLAPHVKTTLSIDVARMQLESGAWGMTAANLAQAEMLIRAGSRRIIIANQIVQDRELDWLLQVRQGEPELEILTLVDSVASVDALARAAARAPGGRPLRALVEVGQSGGRAGVRTLAEGLEVARRVSEAPGVELAGVECFEGATGESTLDRILASVSRLLELVAQLAGEIDRLGLVGRSAPPLCTAGGSAYFDRVVADLTAALPQGWQIVLRSGCYVTHDHGLYADRTPSTRDATAPQLRAALGLWARVLSIAEPGLAIVGFGRRDAGSDAGMPIPLTTHRGEVVIDLVGHATCTALNDQHAYISFSQAHVDLQVADLVEFGISHPCTTIDKWSEILVVDDQSRVIDTLKTERNQRFRPLDPPGMR